MTDNNVQQKIGVFLAVDSPITRQGANSMVSRQEDMEVVGQTGNVREALSMMGDILPKTVVVVHTIPPKGSFELVYRLREISPEVSVIVLAEYEDDDGLLQAIMAGASAFLTKESTNGQLLNTVRKVFNGEQPVSQSVLSRPRVASRILERFQELSSMTTGLEPLVAPLSSSESEVLHLIASGNPTEALTHSLNISKDTAQSHVTSILHKLNVNERTRNAVAALSGWGGIKGEPSIV